MEEKFDIQIIKRKYDDWYGAYVNGRYIGLCPPDKLDKAREILERDPYGRHWYRDLYR